MHPSQVLSRILYAGLLEIRHMVATGDADGAMRMLNLMHKLPLQMSNASDMHAYEVLLHDFRKRAANHKFAEWLERAEQNSG